MVHAPDGVEQTARCLAAVAATVPPEIAYDVVVVDDATTDATPVLLACCEGDVQVVRTDEPLGFPACANHGAALARSDVLVLVPERAAVPEGWLEALLAALTVQGVGAACGPFDGGLPAWLAVRAEAFADAGGLSLGQPVAPAVNALLAAVRHAGWSVAGWPGEPAGTAAASPGEPRACDTGHDGPAGVVRRLEQAAEGAAAIGQPELALASATAAAEVAWFHHPGRFTSPKLERILHLVGRRLTPLARRPSLRPRPAAGDVARVLHVLTEAYNLGGHTRLAWRWMAADGNRHHEIVLTSHSGPVPEALVSAADGVHDLATVAGPSLAERAVALREIATGADVVVCHTHPHDAVAVAALAAPRPPVVYVNHAGHVFWIGTGVADVVACTRESTARLAVTRRGIDPRRIAILPVPVDPLPPPCSTQEARRQLGLDPEAVVLLSVASAYKYEPLGDVGFRDLVVPALLSLPAAVCVVVGPEPLGPWKQAAFATGGRVIAAGRRANLALFYAAADVYLDSYPLCSTTAFLEGAAAGLPVLTYQPHGREAGPFAADDPALGEGLVVAHSEAEYRERLASLVLDETLRHRLGERAAEGVRLAHSGEGWLARLESVYSTASTIPPARPPVADVAESSAWIDRALAALHRRAGAPSIDHIVARHMGAFVGAP